MDNNKDPKEELKNDDIPSSATPTDSENENNTVASATEDIANDTDTSVTENQPESEAYAEEAPDVKENEQSAPYNPYAKAEWSSAPIGEEPMGFGYYAQHPKDADPSGKAKKKPWIFEKDADVPKDYNPYREDRSVFKEIFEENQDMFCGNAPLPEESPEVYGARINFEWRFARSKAASKLKKSSTLIALSIILYLALSNGFAMALSALNTIDFFSLDILNNILMFLQYAFMFPAVLYVINLGKKHKTLTFFKKCEVSKFYIFKWSIISLGVTYLVALVGNFIFAFLEAMGVHINDLSSALPTDPIGLIIYFLAVVICAPIFEEILFRGSILTENLKHGAVFASVISGVLFGLIHQNHEQMFFAAVLGFIFCFIDIKAGSIIPSIIAHMVVNGYSFLNVLFLSFTNYNDTMEDPTIALDGPGFALVITGILNTAVYVFIVIAIILIIHELTTNSLHFFLSKGDNLLTGGEKSKIYLSNPATIIMLILLTLSIIINSFVDVEALMTMFK